LIIIIIDKYPMRNFLTLAALFTATTLATRINLGAAEDKLDLAYDPALSCGGCVRAGYYYCISKKDKHRGRVQNDFCCDSKECVLEKMAYHDYECATQFENET
jgi:hypothetical protein